MVISSALVGVRPPNDELQRTRPAASRWSLAAELSVRRTHELARGGISGQAEQCLVQRVKM